MSSSRSGSGSNLYNSGGNGGGGGGVGGGGSNSNLNSGNNGGLNNLNTRSMRDYGSTANTSSTAMITGGSGGGGSSLSSSNARNVPDVNFAGFSPTEFISLSENIEQNIKSVISCYQTLDRAARVIGTHKDNQTFRNKIHQMQTITNNKITSTNKDIHRLTVVVRGGDKQQSLLVKKLSSDFKGYVELYHTAQQKIAAKMKSIVLPSSLSAMQQGIMDDDEASSTNDKDSLVQQEQKRLNRDLKFEQSILQENENRVKQIEADVLDINQIMRELNSIITFQGNMINTIEDNVEQTVGSVEDGTSELLKATQSQAKYRKKVVILLIIAVIVGIIVAGIIVAKLNK